MCKQYSLLQKNEFDYVSVFLCFCVAWVICIVDLHTTVYFKNPTAYLYQGVQHEL